MLLAGGAEIIKPALSSADLQFLENRKFSRAEICTAFGVPEEIVILSDNAKYDVMAGSRLNFIENRVAPLCTRLEAEEDATVIHIGEDGACTFGILGLPFSIDAGGNFSRLTVGGSGENTLNGDGSFSFCSGSFTATTTANLSATSLTASGDIEITDTAKGVILKSPGGTRYRLKVANDGTLSTESVP